MVDGYSSTGGVGGSRNLKEERTAGTRYKEERRSVEKVEVKKERLAIGDVIQLGSKLVSRLGQRGSETGRNGLQNMRAPTGAGDKKRKKSVQRPAKQMSDGDKPPSRGVRAVEQ